MALNNIDQYIEDVRGVYLKACKKEKGKILDEFTKVTGCHRKAAIRLLRHSYRHKVKDQRGRPRQYGNEINSALKTIWEASDHLCSKRLQPFLPELVSAMTKHSEIKLAAPVREQLTRISSSTIDRHLEAYRKSAGYRRFSTTKPGSLLKNSIPIRTFADWQENRPGFLEVDLIAHCGESVDGFYLNTLSTVDVATGWSECMGVWGKGQERVGSAVHQGKTATTLSAVRTGFR